MTEAMMPKGGVGGVGGVDRWLERTCRGHTCYCTRQSRSMFEGPLQKGQKVQTPWNSYYHGEPGIR